MCTVLNKQKMCALQVSALILNFLQPPKSEADEELVHEVVKTPEVKHWESFGSCLEIEAESVKVTREKVLAQSNPKSFFPRHTRVPSCNHCIFNHLQLRFKFSRVRRKFEAPVCFSDRALADIKKGHIICASYQDRRFSIKQIQCDRGIQAVASVQTGSTQTLRYACRFSTRNRIQSTGRRGCSFSAKTCQLAKMSVFMHSNYTSRSHILSIK